MCTLSQNTSCKTLSPELPFNVTNVNMSQLTSEALQLRPEITEEDLNSTLAHLTLLKVPQLKELCKSIGLTQKGKKQDLIDRLHQFITSCASTRDKGSLFLAARTIVLKVMNNDPVPNFANLCNVLSAGLIDHQRITGHISRLHSTLPTSSTQRKTQVSHASHVANSNLRSSQLSAYYPKYQGPMLLFQSTIFYTLRRMIHGFPYVMVASMGRNVCNVPVHLDKDEISALRLSSTAKVYFFCALSSTPNPNRADLQFPPIEIYVDGVNTKQYVKGLKGKAGTCRPADLTSYIKDINRQFTINIVYSDAAEPYIVYLYVVDARSPEEITKMIVESQNFIPSAITKETIRAEYELNQDDDIVMATSSISLRCPLSYARMTYPVKSIQCDHIQCFDAISFLTMQERIPSWICPVCSTKINQQLLALSKYMQEILLSTSEDVDTVTLNPDGSWTAVVEGAEESAKPKGEPYLSTAADVPAPSAEPVNTVDDAIEIISLGSDTEDEQEEVTVGAIPPETNTINTSFAMGRNSEEPHNAYNTSAIPAPSAYGEITDSNGASISTTEANHSTAPSTAQTHENVLLNHGTSMVNMSADVSSDDEPIHSYGRRRNHIIEDSAPISEVPSSHSALQEVLQNQNNSVQANPTNNDVAMTNLRTDSAPFHDERQHIEVTRNILNAGHEPVRNVVTGYSSSTNDNRITQMEKCSSPQDTTTIDNDHASSNPSQRGESLTSLLHQQDTETGIIATPKNVTANENVQRDPSGSLPLVSNNTQETPRNGYSSKSISDIPNHGPLNSNLSKTNESNEERRALQSVQDPKPSHTNGRPPAWMNVMVSPDGDTQEGSIINTIQNMFSRSASPQLTTPQANIPASQAQPLETMVVTQEKSVQSAPPKSQPLYSDQVNCDHAQNSSNGNFEGLDSRRDISTVNQLQTQSPYIRNVPSHPGIPVSNGNTNGGEYPSSFSGQARNENNGLSKADAYRKTVLSASQLISLYRQMQGSNNQDPMASHALRKAQISTDGTISFSPSVVSNTTPQASTVGHNSTQSWTIPTTLQLNPQEGRTRSVPNIPTHAQTSWPSVSGETAGTGPRYSRSPFDALREVEQEKQKVRGILDIEVAHDVILPWNSPSRATRDSPADENQNHGNQDTNSLSNRLNAGSRLLYNLPTLNRTTSTPALTGNSADLPTHPPAGKKRSISGSSPLEKTWNKRLNKQKFDPSEMNIGQVIELDD